VVEFCGDAIDRMSTEARMTLCNMAVERAHGEPSLLPTKRRFIMCAIALSICTPTWRMRLRAGSD